MKHYVCIHSHFYQPPRENPWLEEILRQDSAYPYHDWNERITAECYGPNGASLLLDDEGHVINLSNNYSKMSFNFGPTLLSWMKDNVPDVYEQILEGDRLGVERFGGHGPAIAQVYNHAIMPLASRKDKETQVIWGIKDFKHRFKRDPEAMWLAETAVDLETLEILAAHGMKFVILAPRQAKAVRPLGATKWKDVSDQSVDPKKPYLVNLESGKTIAAFFYDGPISQGVAFEGLLHDGVTFGERVLEGFDNEVNSTAAQLVHIATDGESYGHHHLKGDMALAKALNHFEEKDDVQLTIYGQFLEMYPPEEEAQIIEDSSWSCVHGIGRWKEDCGCNSGGRPGWNQKWRGPLREAFNLIREELDEHYVQYCTNLRLEPWALRNDYVEIIMNRDVDKLQAFLERHNLGHFSEDEQIHFWKVMESQRYGLLMYTSCAWFFDEISGLEAVQNLQYSYRTIELAETCFGISLLDRVMEILKKAPSNLPEFENAADVFNAYVIPAKTDIEKLGAHFAVSSLFERYDGHSGVYCFDVSQIEQYRAKSGRANLACGQAELLSRVTRERRAITFGALHFGDHNVTAGVQQQMSQEKYHQLVEEVKSAFHRADFPQTLRTLDSYFGQASYSLNDLFEDEKRKAMDQVLDHTLRNIESDLRQWYSSNYPLMSSLSELRIPSPQIFRSISEFVQNRGIKEELASSDNTDIERVKRLLNEATRWNTTIDVAGLSKEFAVAISEKGDSFRSRCELKRLKELVELVDVVSSLPFEVDLSLAQKHYFLWVRQGVKEEVQDPESDCYIEDEKDREKWHQLFTSLGEKLEVRT